MAITISGTSITFPETPFNYPVFTGGVPGPAANTQSTSGYNLVPGMINKWTAPTRAIGTIYQNATGYPLAVAITIVPAVSEYLSFYLNGSLAYNPYHGGNGGGYMLCTIVPNGYSYSVGPNHALQSWYELRIS
jgi:hypothetical protein